MSQRTLKEFIVRVGLAESPNHAARVLEQGAVRVNGDYEADPDRELAVGDKVLVGTTRSATVREVGKIHSVRVVDDAPADRAALLAGVRLGLKAAAAEAKRWGDTTMTQFREGPAADVAGFEDAAEMAYQVEAAIRALDAEEVARDG